jgi:hypothetical protein
MLLESKMEGHAGGGDEVAVDAGFQKGAGQRPNGLLVDRLKDNRRPDAGVAEELGIANHDQSAVPNFFADRLVFDDGAGGRGLRHQLNKGGGQQTAIADKGMMRLKGAACSGSKPVVGKRRFIQPVHGRGVWEVRRVGHSRVVPSGGGGLIG